MKHLSNFLRKIEQKLDPKNILTDQLSLSIYAHDASLYRIEPKVVLIVENEIDMQFVICMANELDIHIGFRAAGTSLSGQALTDGVLIIQGQGWRNIEVLEHGKKVKCQPGARGSEVNSALKPYHKKLGPDPASIDAAKIGGIAANNASGMCCGTKQNTYQTVDSMRWISSSGHLLDSNSEDSRTEFKLQHPKLIEGIQQIAEEIRCDPELVSLISEKYLLKNTTGYSMNSFLDFHDPIDIINHLLIGSEGTLGFISEITYNTVEELPLKSNALVFFENVEKACLAVSKLKQSNAKAIELMDYQALKSVESQLPNHFVDTPGCTALLIDLHCENNTQLLNEQKNISTHLIDDQVKVIFTHNQQDYAHLWKIRKGMFPSVAAMRNNGETVIIEDIAVSLEHLAEATVAIQDLFQKFNFGNAIIFGHAKEGNLHIVFNQSFQQPNHIENYHQLMDSLCDLITDRYKGSLKAEHGTGRNMAPYVEQEWGPKIYHLMQRIKKIFDPKRIFNPEVIITNDSTLHLNNLKPIPEVNEHIDPCMECGFCERVCPSKDLTLTPRQRIIALREMQLSPEKFNLDHQTTPYQFDYRGNQTCATDGMCAQVCPVSIDTGKMIKTLRQQSRSAIKTFLANTIAKHQGKVEQLSRVALSSLHLLQKLPIPLIKKFPGPLPQSAKPKQLNAISSPQKVVLFNSCMHRVFDSPLYESIFSLAAKAKIELKVLNKSGLCCGLPYASKGFPEAADLQKKQVVKALIELTEDRTLPIVVDNSPCTQQLNDLVELGFNVMDLVSWIHHDVAPELDIKQNDIPIALHQTCSSQKMNLQSELNQLAHSLSSNVIQPTGIDCCGFAGDKGFTHPELNQSALISLKKQLPETCKKGVSNSRTCEIGLSWLSERDYEHIAISIDQQSQPK